MVSPWHGWAVSLLWAILVFSCLAKGSSLLSTASSADIAAARAIVKEAQAKAAELNKARLANPAKNIYSFAPGTVVGNGKGSRRRSDGSGSDSGQTTPPLLPITPEIVDAAALVAEADAAAASGNATAPAAKRLAPFAPFWMEAITRMGSSPWGTNASYTVFRNVKNYGAKGDGVTDDTKAIWNAMNDGNRCGANCNGATVKNAIVYLPAGTYLVSTNITVLYGTQLIGDPNNRPTIKASAGFVGLGVLSTDVYVGDGTGADGKDNEWYINTASFYRQIRNVKIDITATPVNNYVCAIHYQVAQATSLQNVELVATSGTTQQGMFSENGSGGFMSDVTFTGGAFGFYGGNQQFTVRSLTFNGCDTAVQIIWDWAWVWKDVTITNSKVGFLLQTTDDSGAIGSITVTDSTFNNVQRAIVVRAPSNATNTATTGIVLENVLFQSVTQPISDLNGNTLLAGSGGLLSLARWVQGPVYYGVDDRRWVGEVQPVDRIPALTTATNGGLPMAPYFGRSRPQYELTPPSNFVNLKSLGAKGNGVTDDTAALNNAFSKYAGTGTIIFADAGVYIITSTVFIPPGTKIVGEAWTQFAAYGSNFQDQTNPQVMLRVGNPGDTGSVEMQDIIFTTKGPTPGAVLVEWNILADAQGSAGIWDCHARLGGATGTSLTPTECPALTDGTTRPACMTANLVMHLTPSSSGYFENMWLWTADHMVDDPDLVNDKNPLVQLSVFTARGMLIESQAATWLYGTASEHAVMYQYNFYEASNIYAGLLQTETPYYQPAPKAPAPYTSNVGLYPSDPTYDCSVNFGGCDSSWSLILSACSDIHIGALGAYSWFDTYTQDCIDVHTCQDALILLQDSESNLRLEQIITVGANASLVIDGDGIGALANLATSGHPAWSQITYIVPESDGLDDTIDDGPDDVESPCDWTLVYNSLTDVQNDLDNVGPYCAGVYALGVMVDMLGVALANYSDDTSSGYSGKFDTYQSYIKSLVPEQIDACMALFDHDVPSAPAGPCNKYFTCQTSEKGASGPCPPAGYNLQDSNSWDIYYTLVDSDGFWAELDSDYGITQDWVKFDLVPNEPLCIPEPNSPCKTVLKVQHNYPIPADQYSVPNPEDIFTSASENLTQIYFGMSSMYHNIMLGGWNGSVADATAVMVLPATMAFTAAAAMEQIIILAGKIQDAQRKALILEIVGAVLLVLPFVGEVAGASASVILETIGRIATIAGDVGNVGLSMYEIIKDPKSAPMDVIGILGSIGGVFGSAFSRESEDILDMARVLDKADETTLAKIGPEFEANQAVVRKIFPKCTR